LAPVGKGDIAGGEAGNAFIGTASHQKHMEKTGGIGRKRKHKLRNTPRKGPSKSRRQRGRNMGNIRGRRALVAECMTFEKTPSTRERGCGVQVPAFKRGRAKGLKNTSGRGKE